MIRVILTVRWQSIINHLSTCIKSLSAYFVTANFIDMWFFHCYLLYRRCFQELWIFNGVRGFSKLTISPIILRRTNVIWKSCFPGCWRLYNDILQFRAVIVGNQLLLIMGAKTDFIKGIYFREACVSITAQSYINVHRNCHIEADVLLNDYFSNNHCFLFFMYFNYCNWKQCGNIVCWIASRRNVLKNCRILQYIKRYTQVITEFSFVTDLSWSRYWLGIDSGIYFHIFRTLTPPS